MWYLFFQIMCISKRCLYKVLLDARKIIITVFSECVTCFDREDKTGSKNPVRTVSICALMLAYDGQHTLAVTTGQDATDGTTSGNDSAVTKKIQSSAGHQSGDMVISSSKGKNVTGTINSSTKI